MYSLKIKYQEDNTLSLDKLTYNKDNQELKVYNSKDNDLFLKIHVPYKINKIKDSIFDPNNDIDRILLLRNRNFGEYNNLSIKYKINNETKSIGFVFTLKNLFEEDSIVSQNNIIKQYAVRSLIMLLSNKTSLFANEPYYRTDSEYSIFDFYEEDLIICAISKEQINNYNPEVESAILYNLNLLGFYLINSEYRDFIPEKNDFQKQCLEDNLNGGTGTITIKSLNNIINQEPYFNKYIKSLINRPNSFFNRFFLAYQCFEILIDYVTKNEIKQKVCKDGHDLTGHKIKDMVYEIGSESNRIKKLFKHYCTFNYKSHEHTSYNIYMLLSRLTSNLENTEKSNGGWFYEFRNQLVHNLRLFYVNSEEETEQNEQELKELVNQIEFLTIEAILDLKL